MMRRRVLLLAFLVCLGWQAWDRLCPFWAEAPAFSHNLVPTGRILVVGDLQRTSLVEQWLLQRENNDAARAQIVQAITDEPDVSGLLLLGDLVFDASSCGDWQEFDALFATARDDMGVMLAVGNHDYWGPDTLACKQVQARFPWLEAQTWELVRWNSIAFLVLDSNDDALQTHWGDQLAFVQRQLDALADDDSIRGVVVVTHHPPYTNSTVTSDELHVQEIVRLVREHTSGLMLFLSGHAHAYEHFFKDDVHFVVSGGGGGPRVSLLSGDNARHDDLYAGDSPRPFHYLVLEETRSGLQVVVRGFDSEQRELRDVDGFEVPWPRSR